MTGALTEIAMEHRLLPVALAAAVVLALAGNAHAQAGRRDGYDAQRQQQLQRQLDWQRRDTWQRDQDRLREDGWRRQQEQQQRRNLQQQDDMRRRQQWQPRQ
ncbi:hypothetical protein [Reyranella sp. CPCC 100927]|uniref:hypothetical protein n=1 Tax=Reyranella sp. CPCC 100927 TaxID=2599616 RepID=UPI0011B7CD7D|nr:hypothetical protein [Reyranella sp. CPCC 100927]TWT04080.1 hypothetical protein FQU96_27235 [Reyranella sp. CPCC 100927]